MGPFTAHSQPPPAVHGGRTARVRAHVHAHTRVCMHTPGARHGRAHSTRTFRVRASSPGPPTGVRCRWWVGRGRSPSPAVPAPSERRRYAQHTAEGRPYGGPALLPSLARRPWRRTACELRSRTAPPGSGRLAVAHRPSPTPTLSLAHPGLLWHGHALSWLWPLAPGPGPGVLRLLAIAWAKIMCHGKVTAWGVTSGNSRYVLVTCGSLAHGSIVEPSPPSEAPQVERSLPEGG